MPDETGGMGAMSGGGGTVSTGGTAGVGGTAGAGGTAGITGTGGSAGGGAASGMGGSAGMGAGAGMGASGGTGGTAGAGGAGGKAGSAGNGGSAGSGGHCTEITLPSTMALRDLTDAPDYVDYEYRTNSIGLTTGANAADYFYVEFYGAGLGYDGAQTGTFTLGTGEESNFETCSRCVLTDQDRGDAAGASFFASAGTMVIASNSDQMNGFPVVTFTDVTLVEVNIDNVTNISTPVLGGRCLHLATGSMSFPTGWTCDPSWYAAGPNDGCDCGCGVRDPDCANGTVAACDFCHCSGDTADCSTTSVRSSNNAVCQ
jgi:hypothetical protein